jgi:hypothetical protein
MAKFGSENKGDKSGHGRDKYVSAGMTSDMHGKSKGGHPTIRGNELNKSSAGAGHHIKEGTINKNCG